MLNINQIRKLNPRFYFGCNPMSMVDWFIITESDGVFCCIRSGLRHADGETLSPFHYEKCFTGKKSKKECLQHFNEWWLTVKHLDIE